MAVAVKSNMTGGIYGHMYLILLQADYRIAINNKLAKVDLLQNPNDVNPKFQTKKKEDLTRYRIMQLKHEMVASMEPEFVKELKNEYTGYTKEMPKTFLAHLPKEYCAATIDNKLKAV
jgi:hypothetical protein